VVLQVGYILRPYKNEYHYHHSSIQLPIPLFNVKNPNFAALTVPPDHQYHQFLWEFDHLVGFLEGT